MILDLALGFMVALSILTGILGSVVGLTIVLAMEIDRRRTIRNRPD